MGLDFSESDVRWSYGGFNSFRKKLAEEIGFNLDAMEGFNKGSIPLVKWDAMDDPIKPFLNHSDCDGELTVDEMKLVAPRLKELVLDWDDSDFDKNKAMRLADDMFDCIEENKIMEFL